MRCFFSRTRSAVRGRAVVTMTAFVMISTACRPGAATPAPSAADPEGSVQAAARDTGDRGELIRALSRAYFPGRVGDIAVIPGRDAVITLPGPDYRYMHGSPWDHDADLLLLMYGPGVFEVGSIDGPASHQDVGATVAELLGLPARADVTGRPLRAALAENAPVPRVVAVLVLDAVRPDHLDRFAEALPNLRRIASEAAYFPEARVDYIPTNTSTAHTTIATGTDPSVHGIVGNTFFDRSTGRPASAYPGASPRNLMTLSIADRWAAATRGRAVIVTQGGTDYPAAALAGRGSCVINGYRHSMAYFDPATGGWSTNEECYRLPPVTRSSSMGPIMEENDRSWLGHELPSLSAARRSSLFTRFEGETAVALIEAEPFGEDRITDLFLANLKSTDYVSHKYGPFSPEMEATLRELDRQLGRIVEALEAKAGPDGLALIITADHGMPDAPASTDVWVTYDDVSALINERFDPGGPGVVAFFRGSENQVYLDHARLNALDLDVDAIARFLESLPMVHAAITEAEVRNARETSPSR